jgi:predicted N-acetyltransferase YhbS
MDFCHSIKLIDENEIIGIGTAILYKDTCWIAHLIVKDKHRNKGIGTKILNYLCDYCENNGCKTILLFATEMGYPLYKKYGFEIQTEYIQYEKTIEMDFSDNVNIRNIEKIDYSKILELDKSISGENRHKLLLHFINNGYVYEKNKIIMGFYLVNLGEGLIIASNEEAGLELSKLRISKNNNSTIPSRNIIANNFYMENKFKEQMRIKRMVCGNNIICSDINIYNRIGGNFG